MDSTNLTEQEPVRQISDPVFRIWTKQYELIIEEDNKPLSLIRLSIHPYSVHNKIWASSSSPSTILDKKMDSIIGKGPKIVRVPLFHYDMAATRVVSSMLTPLVGIDIFDRECLVAEIVSTVRKVLNGPLSTKEENVVNKLWVMNVEIDLTTVYFVDDRNDKEGKDNYVENPLTTSD